MKLNPATVLAFAIAVATGFAPAAAQPQPAATAATAAPPAQRLPAEHYLRPPQIANVSVSPSGQHVALLMTTDNGRRVAAVASLDKPGQYKTVAAFSDANVDSVYWVNDKRLVYTGSKSSYLLNEGEAGVFAVDLDGEDQRQLVAWVTTTEQTGTRIHTRMLPYGWFLHGTVDDGSDDVLMERPGLSDLGDPGSGRLARVNTRTGVLRSISTGAPSYADGWVLDAKGDLRVVRVVRDGREQLFWRPVGSDDWQRVDDRAENAEDSLVPLALEGPEQLLVLTRNGRDTAALHVYDLRQRRVEPEPVAALNGYDLSARLVMNRRKGTLLGLTTTTEQPVTLWFDERLAKVQARVDASLPPDRYNRLICGRCEDSSTFVVLSYGDREPGELLIYDSAAARLLRMGSIRPWLNEASQGRRSTYRVPARDGLPLPVVLTHPPGQDAKAPLPAVMLVHGGPWLRGSDRLWDGEAQFLASRGWRVIEVEFRGSTGFGWKHFRAGWQQWGLAMQDDLADVLAWAAREGWVDAKRACIAGSSYGGYAALMGPIRHPEAWRCAASYAGVTDIDLLFNAKWGDLTDQFKRFGLPALVGDPKADAQRFKATSPLKRVAEIKVPVLLAQGRHDRRVPPEHADRFMSAARSAGVAAERVNYEEGHTWIETAHHADFMRRLEAFIARAVATP